MAKFKISFSSKAKKDLKDIIQYIEIGLRETTVAENLLKIIKCGIFSLSEYPERYAIIDYDIFKKFQLRRMTIKNYVIFYRIIDDEVQIARIIYGRMNWKAILRDEDFLD